MHAITCINRTNRFEPHFIPRAQPVKYNVNKDTEEKERRDRERASAYMEDYAIANQLFRMYQFKLLAN